MAEAKTSARKKQRRSVPSGQLHIQATFNNTTITFTDKKGNALAAASAGACGFRGSKKGTAYAGQENGGGGTFGKAPFSAGKSSFSALSLRELKGGKRKRSRADCFDAV